MIVLANPQAGKKTIRWINLLNRLFSKVYVRKIYEKSKFKKAVIKMADEEGKVVIMGGDGTVNAAVQVLAQTDVPLGIIPTGTGNDFAKELKIPLHPIKAFKLAENGKPRIIGLGRVNNTYFCNSFGIGFDAQVIRNSKSYKQEAFKNIFKFKSFPIKGKLFNGKRTNLTKNVFMVVFANGKTEGGGIRISKNGLKNPKLGVTIVSKCSKLNRLFLFPLFFTNFFSLSNKVIHEEVNFARLKISRTAKMHVDGEVFTVNKFKMVEVQYHPKSLRVITI